MTTASIPESVLGILQPPPRLSLSEWATQRFRIAEKGAARPGPYDLGFTPFWREPLDCLADPGVRKVSIVASAQAGKTQLGNVWLAWTARNRPGNLLYVRPAESDVYEAFRDRFRPLIEANLSDLVGGEWLTVSNNPSISLAGMMIYGAAATTPRHMTSRTCPWIWFDECDSGGAGDNALGNVLDLLDERQMALGSHRVLTLGTSTPSTDDGSNWHGYDQLSDRREYWEPCPLCGGYQPLRLDRIVAPTKDPQAIRAGNLGRLKCVYCEEQIEQTWQAWMADRGVWVPGCQKVEEVLPLDDPEIRDVRSLTLASQNVRWEPALSGLPPNNPHRGYRVWRANTKFEQCSWSNILARFHEVRANGDPRRYQVYVNNWLAEPWRTAEASADEDRVRSRIGQYPPQMVPERSKLILGSIDVQQDSLWYLFRAVGVQGESWLIEYGNAPVYGGAYAEAFASLWDRAFRQGWPVTDGRRDRCYALAVDANYATGDVYEFAEQPGVVPVRGEDYADFRTKQSTVETRGGRPVVLQRLNKRHLGDRLHRAMMTEPGSPGEWHLHRDTTDEYVKQLTSTELRDAQVTKGKRGRPRKTWQLKSRGRPDHLWDCEAYVMGLIEILQARGELSVHALQESDQPLCRFADNPRQAPQPVQQPSAPKPQPKQRPTNRRIW